MNRDADQDGVLDWEESLFGTDPTKKQTTDGIPDSTAIAKLKSQAVNEQGESLLKSGEGQETENLTETEKFSREFFSTIATLNQTGAMDQTTVDKLSESLALHIQNSPQRKVYELPDIKMINKDDVQTVKTYDEALDNIYKKYPVKTSAVNVLQKFVIDEDAVNVEVLSELNPIIDQTKKIINALIKISVPQSLATLHVSFVNGLEMVVENLEDIKLYDTDVIVSLSGISQYQKNTATLESATNNLGNAIKQKLSN